MCRCFAAPCLHQGTVTRGRCGRDRLTDRKPVGKGTGVSTTYRPPFLDVSVSHSGLVKDAPGHTRPSTERTITISVKHGARRCASLVTPSLHNSTSGVNVPVRVTRGCLTCVLCSLYPPVDAAHWLSLASKPLVFGMMMTSRMGRCTRCSQGLASPRPTSLSAQ